MSRKLLSRYVSSSLMFLLVGVLTGCGGAASDQNSSSSVAASSVNNMASSVKSAASSATGLKDTVPPTAPLTVTKTLVTTDKVELSWSAATDNIAVTAYKVFRNQILIATLDANTLSYTDTTIVPNTTYTYSIKAGDAAGLWSPTKSLATKTLSAISTPTSSASSSSSSAKATNVAGRAMFKWIIPSKRENESALDTAEIGGYEIRYKLKSEADYTSITITDGLMSSYTIQNLSGDYEFQIAAYDINQIYSQFVSIYPI